MPGGETARLLDLDLLLEEPQRPDLAEVADYDLETGRLNPPALGPRTRSVYIRKDRITPPVDDDGQADTRMEIRGQFTPCAVCGETAAFGRTSVQDHQTKGDQPFQALVSRQLHVQPPGSQKATSFAPLRGRKVLVFSDSRQVAARLAPNLQMYSVRDSLRALIVWGFQRLHQSSRIRDRINLEDLYLATLLASKGLGVRLRPEVKSNESFAAETTVAQSIANGALDDDVVLQNLWIDLRSDRPPAALLDDIIKTVQDRYLGLEALALASICEAPNKLKDVHALPIIPGLAETADDKTALVRAWLRCWRSPGFWLNSMPGDWYKRPRGRGTSVRAQKGSFSAMRTVLSKLSDKNAYRKFDKEWQPALMTIFAEAMDSGFRRLLGRNLSLLFEGDWVRCRACRSVHRPVPKIPHCLDCGSVLIVPLDPVSDPVFVARKGYYRSPVVAALADPNEHWLVRVYNTKDAKAVQARPCAARSPGYCIGPKRKFGRCRGRHGCALQEPAIPPIFIVIS
jgi:hypothetical protein